MIVIITPRSKRYKQAQRQGWYNVAGLIVTLCAVVVGYIWMAC